jgi:hypothetical protein
MAHPSYYAIECKAKVAPTPFAEDRWRPCWFVCVCVARMIERLPLTAKCWFISKHAGARAMQLRLDSRGRVFDGRFREHPFPKEFI